MRISDWSSDVCSSDLHVFQKPVKLRTVRHAAFVTQIKRITDEGHSALLHCHRPTEKVSIGSADQHLLYGDTAARRHIVAGQPHKGESMLAERAFHQPHSGSGPIGK